MHLAVRRLRLPVLALLLVLGACGGDERSLEQALGKVYGEVFATFDTGDQRTLRVTFLSSPFAERPDAERRVTARKVAEYVRDHYLPYKGLDKVAVEFMSKKEMAADSLRHAAAGYTFTRAELGPPRP